MQYLMVYVRHDSRLKFNPFNARTGRAVRAKRNATVFPLEKLEEVRSILQGMLRQNPAFEWQIKKVNI